MIVEAGVLIGNRFRLRECIGYEGRASVWRASERVPGKEAVVRVVSGASAEVFAAMQSLATNANALRHRGLARVQQVGRLPDGSAWIATDFAHGRVLEDELDVCGRLPRAVALALFRELACSLAELHRHGFVHRSLSARTIVVERSRAHGMRPKLIALDRALLSSARHGAQQPAEASYSSPEVVASDEYGTASDIWALGVLLFRCVHGRLPFVARTPAAFAKEVRTLPRILAAIEDESIRGLIEQCLALEPAARPTAAALIDQADLAALAFEPEPIIATVEPASVPAVSIATEASLCPTVPSPAPMPPMPPPELLRADRRRRRPEAMVLLVVIAAAAIFVGWIVATREPRRPAATTTGAAKAATTSIGARAVLFPTESRSLEKPCK